MRRAILIVTLSLATIATRAQWQIQDAHTKASLRGIHSLGNGVAWASGTDGTILRTTDGGKLWQHCSTPPNAEHLDFRGIQGLDRNIAIAMSSGEGDLSRLYKTTDACKTWQLLFSNPDKKGFWDAVVYNKTSDTIFILGDPVDGNFRLFFSQHGGKFSSNWNVHPIDASAGQEAFAASNSLLLTGVGDGVFSFITGGAKSEIIHEENGNHEKNGVYSEWSRNPLPFASGEGSGAFSMAAGPYDKTTGRRSVVVVGGDYLHPDAATQTAAFSTNNSYKFEPSETMPHGYRSAVAYDAIRKVFITAGPTGTDISIDDGRNWHTLKPGPNDQGDADKNWNALSLPFAVGTNGRIGIFEPTALRPTAR